MVIPEVGIRRSEPVDSPSRLSCDLVGILLREKYNGVCGNAVPAFAASRILDEVHPFVPGGNFLVLVAIPLRNLSSLLIPERSQNIQFIIVAVEDDGLGVVFQNLQRGNRSGLI